MSFVLYDGTETPPIPLSPRSSHRTRELARAYINHLRNVIHLGNDQQYHVNQYFQGTQQECINFVNNIQIFEESESEDEYDEDVIPTKLIHHHSQIPLRPRRQA